QRCSDAVAERLSSGLGDEALRWLVTRSGRLAGQGPRADETPTQPPCQHHPKRHTRPGQPSAPATTPAANPSANDDNPVVDGGGSRHNYTVIGQLAAHTAAPPTHW